MRKRRQSFDRVQNTGNHLVSGGRAALGDKVPDLRKVVFNLRVKVVPVIAARLAARRFVRVSALSSRRR